MKLSEILKFLKKANPAKIWKPRIWVPDPMKYPVTVYILSDKDFEIACKARKFNKKLGAFAVWEENKRVSTIYMRYHKLYLFNHEIRHLQKGHFHE